MKHRLLPALAAGLALVLATPAACSATSARWRSPRRPTPSFFGREKKRWASVDAAGGAKID